MSRELLNEITISPINFFSLSLNIKKGGHPLKREYLLPKTAELCYDITQQTDVSLGWSLEGISILIAPYKKQLPKVELFFDTRSIKSAIFNHKFCHHFLFESDEEGVLSGKEVTRFRTEDSHPLCDPDELKVENSKTTMAIFIPTNALFGYDPQQFDRIGFTYKISYDDDVSQHFSVSSDEFTIDQNPSLWATLYLK